MRRKSVLVGMCIVFALGMTACGSTAVESVAEEQEIVVVKDEPNVATAQKPAVREENTAEINKKQKETTKTKTTNKDIKEEIKSDENVLEEVITGADGKVDEADFATEINETVVKMGEDINTLLEELGEPEGLEEVPNCLGNGKDKIYTYGGIKFYTHPNNGKDKVYLIEYNGEEKTLSGIGIGSTRADIEEAYGIEYDMDGSLMIYTYKENVDITFYMDGTECTSIEIYWE